MIQRTFPVLALAVLLAVGCRKGKQEDPAAVQPVPPADPEVVALYQAPPRRTPEDNEKVRQAWGKWQAVQAKHNFLMQLNWTGQSVPMLEEVVTGLDDPLYNDIKTKALQLEANTLMQQERRQEAVALFQKTARITADPNQRYHIMQNIANLYGLMGKRDDQIAVFHQMLDEVTLPQFKGAVVNQLVGLYAQDDRYEEAITLFDRVVNDPELLRQPIAQNMLNRLIPSLMKVDQDDQALALIDTLEEKVAAHNASVSGSVAPIDLENSPQYQQALLLQTRLLRQQGKFQEGADAVVPLLDKMHNKQGFITELLQVAQGLGLAGNVQGALDLVEKLKAHQTDYLTQGKLLFAQADLEYQQGNTGQAIAHLREVQKLFQDDPYKRSGVGYFLGMWLRESGDEAGAAQEFNALLNPPNLFTAAAREALADMGQTPGAVRPMPRTMTPPAPPTRPTTNNTGGGILPD